MSKLLFRALCISLWIMALPSCKPLNSKNSANMPEQLTIYTERNYQLIAPVIEQFTHATGIEVRLLTGSGHGLLQRIKTEGKGTPASLFISVDAGTLWLGENQGLFQKIEKVEKLGQLSQKYKSVKDHWTALSFRARTIFYNPQLVDQKQVKGLGYASLSRDHWYKKLCLRTSKKVYNQSLIASLIARYGSEQTQDIVQGWVHNLKHNVFFSDTKLLEAIDRGECDIGIANTYYYARMLASSQQGNLNIAIHFPSLPHVNISGIALLKHAPNKNQALQLIQWLLGEQGQTFFSQINHEYPVFSHIDLHPILSTWLPSAMQHWEKITSDPTTAVQMGSLQREAMLIIDKVKYP